MILPPVTVGIPVLNGFQNLRNLVNSIQLLNMRREVDIRFVVVDDGAPTQISRRIEQFCDSRGFVYLQNEGNQGIPFSWNRIVSRSEDEFVFLLNDDVIANDVSWIERAIHVFRNNPFVGIVSFAERRIRADGSVLSNNYESEALPLLHCWPSGSFFGIRKSLWQQVRQPDGSTGFWAALRAYCEDWDFGIEMNERGYATCVLRNTVFDHLRSQTVRVVGHLHYNISTDESEADLSRLMEISQSEPAEPRRNIMALIDRVFGFERHRLIPRGELSRAMLANKWKFSLDQFVPSVYASARASRFRNRSLIYLDSTRGSVEVQTDEILYSPKHDVV